jgi:hypothetical protein
MRVLEVVKQAAKGRVAAAASFPANGVDVVIAAAAGRGPAAAVVVDGGKVKAVADEVEADASELMPGKRRWWPDWMNRLGRRSRDAAVEAESAVRRGLEVDARHGRRRLGRWPAKRRRVDGVPGRVRARCKR